MITQYLLRKGLSEFKKFGETEVEKELNQLQTNSTLATMHEVKMSEK